MSQGLLQFTSSLSQTNVYQTLSNFLQTSIERQPIYKHQVYPNANTKTRSILHALESLIAKIDSKFQISIKDTFVFSILDNDYHSQNRNYYGIVSDIMIIIIHATHSSDNDNDNMYWKHQNRVTQMKLSMMKSSREIMIPDWNMTGIVWMEWNLDTITIQKTLNRNCCQANLLRHFIFYLCAFIVWNYTTFNVCFCVQFYKRFFFLCIYSDSHIIVHETYDELRKWFHVCLSLKVWSLRLLQTDEYMCEYLCEL